MVQPLFAIGGNGGGSFAKPLPPGDQGWALMLAGLAFAGVCFWNLREGLGKDGSFSVRGWPGPIARDQPVQFWFLAAVHVGLTIVGFALFVIGCVKVYNWETR